jgi:large subunit ribosomal protein L31
MKKNIHPKVRQVVFKDTSSDFSFLGTSTMDSKESIKWKDGKSYPLIKVEISSASHPFFTGKQRVLDTEGRIGRFKKKYGKKWIVRGAFPGSIRANSSRSRRSLTADWQAYEAARQKLMPNLSLSTLAARCRAVAVG